ncbi:MAG: M50 family metallopeptidase [Candidatus Woesearchaeota archaeon]
MMITLREMFDAALMTVAVGYIFMGIFQARARFHAFDWQALWFACLVTAPALILHELSHKFVAIAAGLQATFHAAYFWLGIGVLLRLFHSPLIFFVPAYVSISCAHAPCTMPPLVSAMTAFAGPGLNLALWLASWTVLKYRRLRSRKWFLFWFLTKKINMLLFILNMLPIPGFDGYSVYSGLWQAFG